MGFFSFSKSKKRYNRHSGGHHYKREGLLDKLSRVLHSRSYSSRRGYGHKYSSYSGGHYYHSNRRGHRKRKFFSGSWS